MKFDVTALAISAVLALGTAAYAATESEDATETETAATESAETEAPVYEITGDAKKGARVFKKCKACHEIGPDAKQKTGPVLTGIVGRAAGVAEDFGYSNALMEMAEGGLVWSPEELSAFLEKPKKYMKGTKMSFAGLRKEEQRDDLIAYLADFPAVEE